ncbi:hypothetical protein ED733_008522 [Metarhizium rileyi]|uniref:DUF1308 domain-containing protein n=1 Tax=Metarhizium rileyi (strain RCEF 4871) TaxID=1649241 RepID=A0A5C6GQ23_METRR|nr:hypothetical protein ED733_008522 [Metarhizium rileyi]
MATDSEDSSMSQHASQRIENGGSSRTALQSQLRGIATTSLSVSHGYIPEIEEFEQSLDACAKRPCSGVPAFLRELKKNEAFLQEVVQTTSHSELPKDTLSLLRRKVDVCAVNISHGSIHWDVLKRCRSLVAINQTFQGYRKELRKMSLEKMSLAGRAKDVAQRTIKAQAKVDVHVVESGAEWLVINTIQLDRLARQMTDSGWGWGEHVAGDVVDESEWEDILLVKQITRYIVAARMNRHEYRIPRLRIVMPNIGSDNIDVNVLLDQISRVDAGVQVIIEDRDGAFLTTPPPERDAALGNLLGNAFDGLSETLNLDHTILIDLISDIAHLRVEPRPWHDETTKAQIEEERYHDGFAVKVLYAALENRKLVCTKEAAEHFHGVLATVGTPTEKERGRLLVPLDRAYSDPDTSLRSRFEELSTHALPSTVQFPVSVIDERWTWPDIERAASGSRLPAMAVDVARHSGFKRGKLSILMYGWASGNVTLTSNKEIKSNIRTLVETHRRCDDDYGPAIWRLDITRNLLSTRA